MRSGTSMATPHVTGAIALLMTRHPTLSAGDIKARLIQGADDTTSLVGRVASGGMLNAANSLAGVAGQTVTNPPAQPPVVFLPPWLMEAAAYPFGHRFGGVAIG